MDNEDNAGLPADNGVEEIDPNVSAIDATQDVVPEGLIKDNDPTGVRKRLHSQEKKHNREVRRLQDQVRNLESMVQPPSSGDQSATGMGYTPDEGLSDNSDDARIQKAVRLALNAKEQEEQQRKDAEGHAHVQKRYMQLDRDLERGADKYDDFDEVVRGNDVPFTAAMRDALLFVDNPSDVAYKLGKNKEDLSRISKLHPLDQAREVNKLAFALMNGSGDRAESSAVSNPLNPIKANPSKISAGLSDQTSPAAIRQLMKSGTWK